MDKQLAGMVIKRFEERLAQCWPAFQRIRLKQKDIPNAPIFEWKGDAKTKAWLVCGGGEGDRDLRLFAGWTKASLKYVDAPYCWGGDLPQQSSGTIDALMEGQYKAPPVPYDGIGTRIELPPPPQSLVEVALRNYFDSEEHAVWLDKVVQRESRRKNPPTREQIDVETRLAEREFMKLWGHLIERYPPTLFLIEEEIDRALDPIFSLLEQAVCPFLKHQLGIESFDVLV